MIIFNTVVAVHKALKNVKDNTNHAEGALFRLRFSKAARDTVRKKAQSGSKTGKKPYEGYLVFCLTQGLTNDEIFRHSVYKGLIRAHKNSASPGLSALRLPSTPGTR